MTKSFQGLTASWAMCLQTLQEHPRDNMKFSKSFFLGFILHRGMFKCFLFIVFILYFKGLFTFRPIFGQFHIFMVPNFDNNFSKTCYFLCISKTVCKACYNLYINAQICYFCCILGPLWPVTSEATVAPLPLYYLNMGLRSACAHEEVYTLLNASFYIHK